MISRQPHPSATRFVLASLAVSFAAGSATAQGDSAFFLPGNLVVSRSVFSQNPALPAYPFVFNGDLVDASFGITSRILLDQLTPSGTFVNSLEVPNSSQSGVPATKDQMVTSFSSKSELALNLSTRARSTSGKPME